MTTAAAPTNIGPRIAHRLEETLGPRRYEMWFKGSARFDFVADDATLRVTVPSRFVADWIGRNFMDQLRAAAEAELDAPAAVDLRVDASGFGRADAAPVAPAPAAEPATPAPAERAVAGASFSPRHRLEDFIVGGSNELAFAAAAAVADESTDAGHPLFLHGGCGLGKTHLLQGVCARFLERNPRARVLYTTGEQFTNDYIAAVRANKIEAFRRKVRGLDLLAVDDVHFIADKKGTQQEFLHSFDQIELGGAKVILASDCHPKLIKQFSEALVSRCVRGLVVQIHRPDPATRLRLVQALSRRRGLPLGEGVAAALADRCEGSVREIEGMLTKLSALVAMSRAADPQAQPVVGHAMLRQLIENDPSTIRSRKPVRFDAILESVCEAMGVTRKQVLGSSRHKQVVLARSMTIHLARQMTPMSYPEIAAAMDRPNHSTVITAAQRVTRMLADDQPLLLTTLDGEPSNLRPTELVHRLRTASLARA